MSDIYNVRKAQKREALGGRTPAQVLVYELEKSEYQHQIKVDDIGRISHVFFAHPTSLLLLKKFPTVLLIDCTYKTNQFKLPLLNIIGSTNLNTMFFVAMVFLSAETDADYMWAMMVLKSILVQPDFTLPSVIVTDHELALINALHHVFPMSKRILCI
jgi:MULE transposase domain